MSPCVFPFELDIDTETAVRYQSSLFASGPWNARRERICILSPDKVVITRPADPWLKLSSLAIHTASVRHSEVQVDATEEISPSTSPVPLSEAGVELGPFDGQRAVLALTTRTSTSVALFPPEPGHPITWSHLVGLSGPQALATLSRRFTFFLTPHEVQVFDWSTNTLTKVRGTFCVPEGWSLCSPLLVHSNSSIDNALLSVLIRLSQPHCIVDSYSFLELHLQAVPEGCGSLTWRISESNRFLSTPPSVLLLHSIADLLNDPLSYSLEASRILRHRFRPQVAVYSGTTSTFGLVMCGVTDRFAELAQMPASADWTVGLVLYLSKAYRSLSRRQAQLPPAAMQLILAYMG